MMWQGLYEELKAKKAKGDTLSLEELKYEELYQIWVTEGYSDKEIAKLFDSKKEDVFVKRVSLGIDMETILSNEGVE